MAEETRIIRVTATRCFLGQCVIEVPKWLIDQRVEQVIRRGGATAAHIARVVPFDRVQGTGLATALIQPARASKQGEMRIPLAMIRQHLIADGVGFGNFQD